MMTNMGKFDRVGRVVIAAALVFLALGTSAFGGGILFWIALIVAAIFAVTAVIGNCLFYRVVGLKTCRDC